jgi:hypothetical protein
MLNPLSVFRLGNPAQQPRQTATAPIAKQHASLKEAESSTPSRRALAPVTGNQVNTMQRIKNFVSGPSASTFTVANDMVHQTASAKKVSHQHTYQHCFTLCAMPFHMLFSRHAALVRHKNPKPISAALQFIQRSSLAMCCVRCSCAMRLLFL